MKRATVTLIATAVLRTISIHALVKRATLPVVSVKSISDISIHALVKRATKFKQG